MLLKSCLFELIGTFILILLGDGVVAGCCLNKTKAQGSGWVVITMAWGFAVMCGVFIAGPISGAHFNPAVSIGLAIAGQFKWAWVLPYAAAQMIGAFCGAVNVHRHVSGRNYGIRHQSCQRPCPAPCTFRSPDKGKGRQRLAVQLDSRSGSACWSLTRRIMWNINVLKV